MIGMGRIDVGRYGSRLPHTYMSQLRLFKIGLHIGGLQRRNSHDRLALQKTIPHLDVSLRHIAGKGRLDRTVREVELCLFQRRPRLIPPGLEDSSCRTSISTFLRSALATWSAASLL